MVCLGVKIQEVSDVDVRVTVFCECSRRLTVAVLHDLQTYHNAVFVASIATPTVHDLNINSLLLEK